MFSQTNYYFHCRLILLYILFFYSVFVANFRNKCEIKSKSIHTRVTGRDENENRCAWFQNRGVLYGFPINEVALVELQNTHTHTQSFNIILVCACFFLHEIILNEFVYVCTRVCDVICDDDRRIFNLLKIILS